MSWGIHEYNGQQAVDSTFTTPSGHQGVTFIAASGDQGSPGYYPAYSPNVLAAGGTTLTLNANNTIQSETAWSGSGGGTSQYEPEPAYQQGFQSTRPADHPRRRLGRRSQHRRGDLRLVRQHRRQRAPGTRSAARASRRPRGRA